MGADHDRLAAKLGRPPSTLSGFDGLTADQVTFLCDAIDRACARRRRLAGLALGPALVRLLRARLR